MIRQKSEKNVNIQNMFGFQGRKMKCWGSSETHFDQVSRRSELSSGGKRPFKVRKILTFSASKNKMSGIVRNAFWPSLTPIGVMFER